MVYRDVYVSRNICLKINTNSKRIRSLVKNILDLNRKGKGVHSSLTVEFYLNELSPARLTVKDKFIYSREGGQTGRFSLSFGSALAKVEADARTKVVRADILNFEDSLKERILDLILMEPLRFILAGKKLCFLHASAVSRGRDCVVINGPQRSGKSTLALTLAKNGFNFMADDDCYLRLERGKVTLFPLPTKMGLDNKSLIRYPELKRYVMQGHIYGGRRRISTRAAFGGDGNIRNYNCRMILFPRYAPARGVYMKRLSRDEALGRLCKINCALYPRGTRPRIFWTLYSLTKNADSFVLGYNDSSLDKVPAAINNFLMR